ncbi:MAG TPA: tetratricopeptide repeat protein [Candidatus Angelobacter sp.]|nr:tetratricopeptide repeat protein [Candidatus Angelobacter sp.]
MKRKLLHVLIVTLLCGLGAGTAWSQTGKVEGHITNQGKPVPNAQITLKNVENGRIYKMKADKNGYFSNIAVVFGQYEEDVESSSGEKLFTKRTLITGEDAAGEGGRPDDISVDVSSSGGASVNDAEVARIKEENAKASGINALIRQYSAAIDAKNLADRNFQIASADLKGKSDQASVDQLKKLTDQHDTEIQKDWTDAETALKQMVTADPTHWDYYQALAGAQNGLKQYQDSIDSLEKGIQVAQGVVGGNAPKGGGTAADPAKAKAGIAQMLAFEGNNYLKLNKQKEAIDAFTKSAEMDPNPGVAYFNICATQYNTGNTAGALAACDKAIAADPNRADAYFIKGSLLMGNSTMDKAGKLQAPEGTAEALNKYLQLAPTGAHADDVKQMLAAIGAKIQTTYSEKKKK